MSEPAKIESSEENVPVVIDLGKRKRRRVKDLIKGKPGKLMDEVSDCLEELKNNNVLSGDAQPVIFVVREKKKKGPWTPWS